MSAKVWIDGQLTDKLDARVSVFDHGLLFGDGVAVGTRIYGGRAFRLPDHLRQLAAAASAIGLPLPLSADELTAAVAETIRANGRTEGYVRVLITRGAGTLGPDPRKCVPAVVVVADDLLPYPRELYDAGLDVVTFPSGPLAFPGTLNQLPLVLAKAAALRAGCLEAVLVDADGTVLGTTDGAVFAVAGGALTASAAGPVVRDAVLELGVPSDPGVLTAAALAAAEEAFLAGTAGEVIAVARLDGKPVGGGEGPVARRVRDLYRAAVRAAPGSGYTERRDHPPR